MKLLKKLNKKLLLLLSLLVTILTISIKPVFALASSSVTIDLSGIEDRSFDIKNREFNIWYVSDEKFSEEEVKKQIEIFNQKDEDFLNITYPEHFKSGKTDSLGKVILSDLKDGTYYVREVIRPGDEKHVSSFFIITPLVDNKENKVRPKIVYEKPDVTIKKVDENGNPLKGAIFELYQVTKDGNVKVKLKENSYDENGDENILFSSDENGEILIKNLPIGEYFFKEVKAPEGYELLKDETHFTISEKSKIVLKIVNRKILGKGEHNFFKYDGDSNKGLKNATFKVMTYDEKTKLYSQVLKDDKVYTVTSDDEGKFLVSNLPFGEYYLWEIQAPEGYKVLNDGIKFTISENSSYDRTDIANFKNPNTTPGKDSPGKDNSTKKKSSKKGTIPKTGDITLLVSTLGGIILVIMGLSLVRKGSKIS